MALTLELAMLLALNHLDPERSRAISRWLSAATPPEKFIMKTHPEGMPAIACSYAWVFRQTRAGIPSGCNEVDRAYHPVVSLRSTTG